MAGRFQFDRPWWDNTSSHGIIITKILAKDFICKLLIVDPASRWSAAQALNHPFILNINEIPKSFHPGQHPSIPRTVPTTILYQQKNVKVFFTLIKVPSYPAKKSLRLVPSGNVTRKDNKETGGREAEEPKTQFSHRVSRIASWFRSATIQDQKRLNN